MTSELGNQTPTIRIAMPYERSEGIYAAQLSAAYDLTPLEWQELVLKDWLAVDEDGILIHPTCILEVSRQNGKTGVSDPRETWGLIARGEQILHTAQEFQTAKKAFDRMRKKFGEKRNDPFARYPELNAMVDHYTQSAGQMVLDLTNGGHIEFRTRGNNSDMGRGGTFDLVVVDEAQCYTEEQDAALGPLNSAAPSGSPQTIFMGTPPKRGVDKGAKFVKMIDIARDGKSKNTCMHLWGVNEIGDVLDRERWRATNPSLGYHLLESALEKDSLSMAPDVFAREHLGYVARERDYIDYVIREKDWAACKSSDPKPEGKTAYGVKFSADGSEVCLAGAVIDANGKSRVTLIDRKPTGQGVSWLASWLNERYGKASCVVIDGRNGVDVLVERISEVWKAKDSVIRPRANAVIAATSMLTTEVSEKTLTWYDKQEALAHSATTSVKRSISGGYGFGGPDSAPIEACSLALWGARTSKRNPGRKQRIG